MKKSASVLAIAVLIATLESGLALAQSSGSFNAAGTSASCAIGTGGTFNGGVGNLNVLETGVQTSNGYGTTLIIRPSLVTGLFTDTKISTTVPTARDLRRALPADQQPAVFTAHCMYSFQHRPNVHDQHRLRLSWNGLYLQRPYWGHLGHMRRAQPQLQLRPDSEHAFSA